VKAYIDRYRDAYGVEPICKVLQIAPSCYRRHAALLRNPALRCQRAQRDDALIPDIERVWHANWQVYDAGKVWLQLNREGIRVARCTVERLMRRPGLRGAVRGKEVRATRPDPKAPCPLDRVNRVFNASRPKELWVSDFTYVSTWQGWLYVAFVVDVYARRIVGRRVSRIMNTNFVLDASGAGALRTLPSRQCAGPPFGQGLAVPVDPLLGATGERPEFTPRWADVATATTTRWPRASTVCTRPS
jgi:putative transposase